MGAEGTFTTTGQSVDLESKQKIEREFWRDSKDESPESDSLGNILNKTWEAVVFLDCLERCRASLPDAGRILELGGGQGWAACIYKRLHPRAHVTATDISEYAVVSVSKWERLFEVKVDDSYACASYETREPDASLDLVFCFAAAHHFVAHRWTLIELRRILKPGGSAFYFYEPSAPKYLYALAHLRVNRKRPEVPEDVLVIAELRKMATEIGLELEVDYYPSMIKRGRVETLYYSALAFLPFLQRLLPCSANFRFTKAAAPE